MIRGYLLARGRARRPFVVGRIGIPAQAIDDVNLLVDTGADGTLISPSDATRLRIDLSQLPCGRKLVIPPRPESEPSSLVVRTFEDRHVKQVLWPA
jgi:hypothetical protein